MVSSEHFYNYWKEQSKKETGIKVVTANCLPKPHNNPSLERCDCFNKRGRCTWSSTVFYNESETGYRFKETSLKSPHDVETFVDDATTVSALAKDPQTSAHLLKLPTSVELTVPFTTFKPKPRPTQSQSQNPLHKPGGSSLTNRPALKPSLKPTNRPTNPLFNPSNKPDSSLSNSVSNENNQSKEPDINDIDTRPIMHTTYTSDQNQENKPAAPSLPPLPSYAPPSSIGQSSTLPWCQPGQDRSTFDCQWRPNRPEWLDEEIEIDKGSEFSNNVDMSWIGQIDHFEESDTSSNHGTSNQLQSSKPDIPEVPNISEMQDIPNFNQKPNKGDVLNNGQAHSANDPYNLLSGGFKGDPATSTYPLPTKLNPNHSLFLTMNCVLHIFAFI